jgi:hypothetical protein
VIRLAHGYMLEDERCNFWHDEYQPQGLIAKHCATECTRSSLLADQVAAFRQAELDRGLEVCGCTEEPAAIACNTLAYTLLINNLGCTPGVSPADIAAWLEPVRRPAVLCDRPRHELMGADPDECRIRVLATLEGQCERLDALALRVREEVDIPSLCEALNRVAILNDKAARQAARAHTEARVTFARASKDLVCSSQPRDWSFVIGRWSSVLGRRSAGGQACRPGRGAGARRGRSAGGRAAGGGSTYGWFFSAETREDERRDNRRSLLVNHLCRRYGSRLGLRKIAQNRGASRPIGRANRRGTACRRSDGLATGLRSWGK